MDHRDPKDGYFTGGLLVAIGLIVLMDSLNVVDLGNYINYWPLIIVAFGVRRIIIGRSPRRFPKGGFTIFLGLWLLVVFNRYWGISFAESWPAVLIALGISMAWKSMYPKRSCRSPQEPIVMP